MMKMKFKNIQLTNMKWMKCIGTVHRYSRYIFYEQTNVSENVF